MPPLPDDLIPAQPTLPPDLIAVAPSSLPDDLLPVAPEAPSPSNEILRGTAGPVLGSSGYDAKPLGPVVQTDAGDFYKDAEGNLKAFSNQDFIATDPESGELVAYARAQPTTVLGKARDVSSALALGAATSAITRLPSPAVKGAAAVTETPPLAALPDDLVPAPATIAETTGAPNVSTLTQGADKAGNINLRNIYAPEDVKNAIRDTAAKNAEFMEARRGVITQDETREMASLVGMSPDKLAKRVQGQAFNAEEMFAARELLVNQATRVRDLARTAKGGSDADKALFSEELTRLVAIQEQVSGATAEAGRTLQQFRMMAGATKEQITRLVEAQKAGGIDDILDRVSMLDDPAKVAQFAREAYKAKTSDKLLEVWINALLSGPTTHATNILSNTLVAAWAIPEAAVSAGISKLTGSGIRGREALAKSFGFFEGAKDGLRAGWRTFKTEQPSDLAGKGEITDVAKRQAIGGVTGKIVRIPGRALMAQDELFKSIGYRQEINALAMRKGLNEGLRGEALAKRINELRSNPSEEMMDAAHKAAEKQTFTNPLGPAGRHVIGILREMPVLKLIAPFVRTPVNIFKFAAERSVFAPLFKEVRQNLKGANGAAARDTQLAKIALGSTVSGVAAYMATEGMLTGSGPADPRERGLLYASGWQPYSVKVGDNYYSFGRLEPLGSLMGVAADFVELNKVMSESEKNNIAALIMGSVQKNVTDKTFLRGVSEFIEATQDPERYGAQYIQNLAGTLVPTAVAQYARTRDPYMREVRSTLDKIKERVPGYRESLPARRDIFGEPIRLGGGLGPDIISPIYTSAAKDNPVVSEMLRLKVFPSKPSRQIMGVEMEPAEYDVMQEATGKFIREGVQTVLKAPGWKKLPDEAKADVVEEVIRKSRDIGRATVINKYPAIAVRIMQAKQEAAAATPVAAQP